jgi:hypothetical protein
MEALNSQKPLRNPRHEAYARHRALLLKKTEAFKAAGYKDGPGARGNADRLERDERVRERIRHLVKLGEEVVEIESAFVRRELTEIAYGEAQDDLKYAHKLTALDQLVKLLGIEKPAQVNLNNTTGIVLNIITGVPRAPDDPKPLALVPP